MDRKLDRSNRAPFTDVCRLVTIQGTEDADGYETPGETAKEVFCSVTHGVSRSEFYEAYKAGLSLAVIVEIWEEEYSGETVVDLMDKRYNVIRTYPTGYGTLELSCEEVCR